MDKKAVRVKIYGTEYLLRGESDPEYMQELARMVDEKMRELGTPGSVQTHRVAILTAFTFADELIKARRSHDVERQKFDQSSRAIASLDLKLQEALTENSPGDGESRPFPLVMEEAGPSAGEDETLP